MGESENKVYKVDTLYITDSGQWCPIKINITLGDNDIPNEEVVVDIGLNDEALRFFVKTARLDMTYIYMLLVMTIAVYFAQRVNLQNIRIINNELYYKIHKEGEQG